MRRILCLVSVLLMVASMGAAQNAYGPGRVDIQLLAGQEYHVGWVEVHNNNGGLLIDVQLGDGCDLVDECDWDCGWMLAELHVHAGWEGNPIPTNRKGNPIPGKFDFGYEYDVPVSGQTIFLDFEEDLNGFRWGEPYEPQRTRHIAVHASVVKKDPWTGVTQQEGAWAQGDQVFLGAHPWCRWLKYPMAHKAKTHFIDSPVGGLLFFSPTEYVYTDESGSAFYFPGESASYFLGTQYLGTTVLDHKNSPLDLFAGSDIEDPRVINMAMLLQSLDVDADPKPGIMITAEVEACFDQAVGTYGYIEDWGYDYQVDAVVDATIANCVGIVDLLKVSREDARDNLDRSLNTSMFRKNVSKTPDLGSTKAKMNIMTVWFPAMKANGEPATYTDDNGIIHEGIHYYDEDGNLIRTATEAKPIVITYTDDDPVTGEPDVWAGVSRDDGNSFKRKNLSRAADRSSFTLENGNPFYGAVKKPVFQVKGNKILVAWTSKYARGGKPAYSIDTEDDYVYDDPYWTDDIWGVAGPQRSRDYTRDGYPEVGEVPYSAVWTCRGVIATQANVDAGLGGYVGDIIWFKPERLTSGRRDANLIFAGAASNAGFGIVWQEDPKGLRPGRAVGPGPGWGGATTAHKTDIWYSFVTWGDHSKVDFDFLPGGDPEHDLDHITRPKALVPMSLPIRISDNDVLNKKNMMIDTTTYADDVSYLSENLTRCVKYEGGKIIVEPTSDEQADYYVLRATPDDHYASMNCTNCHVPFGTDPMGDTPTQGAPIPLVVVDAPTQDYLGGFTNGDCVSCHYSHVVPRDRVITMTTIGDEGAKCAECESKGGIWKDGADGGEILEAYYPYEGYPYIVDNGDEPDGTHRYGLELDGLLKSAGELVSDVDFYTFINHAGNETSVGITLGEDGIAGTEDDLLMDGDTGASRGNLFMQPYTFTKPDGSTGTSAWAIVTYEETKGAGSGPPDDTGTGTSHRDDYVPESGKNVIYHSFDFKTPDKVSPGDIMNTPEAETVEATDGFGNPIVLPVLDSSGNITPKYLQTEEGEQILDWKARPQLVYENARRGRFILQGPGGVRNSRTQMLMVYKMGEEGTGRPSDIMAHRWVIPEDEIVFKYDSTGKINGVLSVEGNPYRFENVQGNRLYDSLAETWYWASGPVNMSSVTPTVTTDSEGDPDQEDAYGAVKVVEWVQTVDNLADLSAKNPFDDARAHRGQIRGDFVQLGFSYTPNWAAARNGHDNYDFFIRRSFNGGETWTTKSAGQGGVGVEHCYTWTYPSGTQSAGTKVEECNFYPAGEFESMRNLSQLKNNHESVIEPRIVAVPGTIKANGVWTGIPEDKQNSNVFYVAWGTSDNPIKDPITKEQDEATPADLFYSFSIDKGETYFVDEWVVNPDSDGNNSGETVLGTPWMAKGDQEQGEVQLRMTPDGSRFYASWLDEGEEGSDIIFRRIMSSLFPQNVAP